MGKKELALRGLTDAGESTIRAIARLRFSDESTERILILISTLVEGHVAKSLRALVGKGSDTRDKFESALVGKAEESMYMSWPSMFDWLSSGFDVQVKGSSAAQAFDSCIDVRNAIIHGDGKLTEMQSRNLGASIATRGNAVKKLGVSFVGNRVIMGEDTREKALLAARDFVLHFDAQLLARFPDLRGVVHE